ncbi:MAG: fluoride efflux transporter CrcB [Chloroflexi bacterium]|nr:fluoride efflux transporter CrcB [Chloroflexota bacterium]MCY3697366.1 fluoride efflux transporter CrcB [Chloroflexota bacterium]MXX32219.1 fluoride efflux transporter CrcB [Chloroflexota bacterium]MXX81224.1 fluoride efflux transporter CrcB [Chloroflexota bacterium]MYB23488.1 fluoride efflux transporter CrcB [Chloroflexota bacterium]
MTVAAIASIALGGAAGSVLRYVLNRWVGQPDGLPLGILVVNLSGTLALGIVATLFLDRLGVPDNLRLAITVGLLGGFTTFSTVWLDTLHLLNGGRWAWALTNLVVSAIGGLAAAWLGQQLARL